MPEYSFLVVGLGNPGPEYANTPHNIGFLVLDAVAAANSIRVTRKENSALVGVGSVARKPVVLAKPQTYMNLSGPSVKGLLQRYELAPGQLLVVYDELDLPWTTMRIKPKGSAAGHMEGGLKDVSEVGCLITTKSLILPGTDLKLVLTVSNYDLSFKGQARHAALDVGLGIEFREIRKGDRAVLQHLLRKLAEKENETWGEVEVEKQSAISAGALR